MRRALFLLPALCLLLSAPAGAQEPPVTRCAFIHALWEMAGAVPYEAGGGFFDVAKNDPCATAVGWAAGAGLVLGGGGGQLFPGRSITREEAAVILRRYADSLGRDTAVPLGLSLCNDEEDMSPWAGDSLYWATETGLFDWSPGGRLDPHGAVAQAELEEILSRFADGGGSARG